MSKRYALLVISTEPIDVGKLNEQKAVEHFFNEEFNLVSKGWGIIIKKEIPKQSISGFPYCGYGTTVSAAITDWFHSVCDSRTYNPIRNRRG